MKRTQTGFARICSDMCTLHGFSNGVENTSTTTHWRTWAKAKQSHAHGFLFVGKSCTPKYKYILVMKDDLSGCTRLLRCIDTDACSSARWCSRWTAYFGNKVWLVLDSGTQPIAHTMKHLAEQAQFNHRLVTAYRPWANGPV